MSGLKGAPEGPCLCCAMLPVCEAGLWPWAQDHLGSQRSGIWGVVWVSPSHGAGEAVVGIGRGMGCGKAPHLINTVSKGLVCPKTSECLSGARAIPSLLPGLRNLFLRLVMSTT